MGESGPGKCKLRRPAGNPTAEEFLDAPSKAALRAVALTLAFSLSFRASCKYSCEVWSPMSKRPCSLLVTGPGVGVLSPLYAALKSAGSPRGLTWPSLCFPSTSAPPRAKQRLCPGEPVPEYNLKG